MKLTNSTKAIFIVIGIVLFFLVLQKPVSLTIERGDDITLNREGQIIINDITYECSVNPTRAEFDFTFETCPSWLICQDSISRIVFNGDPNYPSMYFLADLSTSSISWATPSTGLPLGKDIGKTYNVDKTHSFSAQYYQCVPITSECQGLWKCIGDGNLQYCDADGWGVPTKNQCSDYIGLKNYCKSSAEESSVYDICSDKCVEDWDCTGWSVCQSNGQQTRTCTDDNSCGTNLEKPATTRGCTYIPTGGEETTSDTSNLDDMDGDGIPNDVDTDIDGDGIPNDVDTTPTVYDPGIGIKADNIDIVTGAQLKKSLCALNEHCEDDSSCISLLALRNNGYLEDTLLMQQLKDMNEEYTADPGFFEGLFYKIPLIGTLFSASNNLGAIGTSAGIELIETSYSQVGYCIIDDTFTESGDLCRYVEWSKPVAKALGMEDNYCIVGFVLIALILLALIMLFKGK